MRISDWSSDVCSSDLFLAGRGRGHADDRDRPARALDDLAAVGVVVAVQNEFRPRLGDDAAERLGIDQPLAPGHLAGTRRMVQQHPAEVARLAEPPQDPTSVARGTSVYARVAIGGRRNL